MGNRESETGRKRKSYGTPENSSTSQAIDNGLQSTIWSLEMQNHPSWNILTNLVDKYLVEQGVERTEEIIQKPTNVLDDEVKRLRKMYKDHRQEYKKYKHQWQMLKKEESRGVLVGERNCSP